MKVADFGNNLLQGSIPARIGAAGLTLMSGPGPFHLCFLYSSSYLQLQFCTVTSLIRLHATVVINTSDWAA